jgi:uncharacterized protein with von Willebrand factor type A (vWA) domain
MSASAPPAAPPVPPVERIVAFGRLLRARGVRVTQAETQDALRAVELIDVGERAEFRAALRATLVHRYEDQAPFDAAFERFWRLPAPADEGCGQPEAEARDGGEERRDERPAGGEPRGPERDGDPGGEERARMIEAMLSEPAAEGGEDAGAESGGATYSPALSLVHRDFGQLGEEEREELEALCEWLARRLAMRLSRRLKRAPRGERLDVRRSLRRSLRTGGDVLSWSWRRRPPRWTRLVCIADVSGSMEAYSRFLLRFVRALSDVLPHVEAFVFSTSLTRVTDTLRRGDPSSALHRLFASGGEWAGGTRIGQSLRQLHERFSRLIDRRTLVMVLSDGLDTGDVDLLAREMEWLRRASSALFWLNPLASDPAYEPLCLGMQAAMPFVDVLAPAGNLAHLMALEGRLGPQFRGPRARRPVTVA